MNYNGATIMMDGGTSTCAVIDWIIEHGCPDLDHTLFVFTKFGYDGLVVSSEACDLWDFPYSTTPKLEDWHKLYNGARRYWDGFNWWIYVGGRFYRMTH